MENIVIRPLKADEIECRIGMIKEKGLSLLLYKDARVDQKILDETVGVFGWKREHQSMDGSLYCVVSIKNPETEEWVSKQDVGSASEFSEREKSLASDSFKRACVNWGIGRELYTAPFIWIGRDKTSILSDGKRLSCPDRFKVSDISYSPTKEILSIAIENQDGRQVYFWKRNQNSEAGHVGRGISQSQKEELQKELKRTGVSMKTVNERFHVSDPDAMSPKVYAELMKALSHTKSRRAA